MYGNKTYLVFMCCVLTGLNSIAQGTIDSLKRGKYSFVVYAGSGISMFSTEAGVPEDLETEIKRSGLASTVRLQWRPDHRVYVGIESGYTSFYSYTIGQNGDDGKLSVTAVPLLVQFSMPVAKRITLHGGAGSYIITTHLDYAGIVKSKSHSLGWMAAASYSQPVSKKFFINSELKWLNASEHQLGTISLQIIMAWKFYEW
jgi:hypothetical protein